MSKYKLTFLCCCLFSHKSASRGNWMRLKPLSHQTAMPQRSKNLLARCGVAAKYVKNIKFASYSVYTSSSQCPYSVHTTFSLYSVYDASTARKKFPLTPRSWRAHDALTARTQGAYRVLTAIIAFKVCI